MLPAITDDQCFITLRHANGSISQMAYLAGGDKAFPKERVEVLGGGRLAVIDDFREVITSSGGKRRRVAHGGRIRAIAKKLRAFAASSPREAHAPSPGQSYEPFRWLRSSLCAAFAKASRLEIGACPASES